MTAGQRILQAVSIAAAPLLWRRWSQAADTVERFAGQTHDRLHDIGAVDALEVLPLVERHVSADGLRAEVGVAYLLTLRDRDRTSRLLFDVGLNARNASSSALVRNAETLGVDLSAVDGVVLSHAHEDHMGGHRARRRRRPSFAGGAPMEPAGAPLFIPVPLVHDRLEPRVTTGPTVIAPGAALLPPAPATLWWEGVVTEQALAVVVRGIGLVVISGCGHPGTSVVLDLAAQVLGLPVYGVIGGLHLPVLGLPDIAVLGSPRPPWRLLGPPDVDAALEAIVASGAQLVALSGHDSSEWTARRFATQLGSRYRLLRVGEAFTIGSGPNAPLSPTRDRVR